MKSFVRLTPCNCGLGVKERILPMKEDDRDLVEEGQLDLFGIDRIKLGEGYAALKQLDLDRAASIFNELILENHDFSDANQGYAMAVEWSDTLWDVETRIHQESATVLWHKIQTYPFGQWGGELRTALIRKTIALIDGDATFYIPPDLCLGYLFLELADYERAEGAYRQLLEKQPNDTKLICRLVNSIFLQKRQSEARHYYAKALLAFPLEAHPNSLEDTEVKDIIKECGVLLAPVYGWLRGVLPLVDIDDIRAMDEEHAKALIIYRSVYLAESARKKRDHQDMVVKRRDLKQLAPEVFEEYITHFV
jgi:tetratricopeptide (TPR) repeat protein